MCLRSYDLYRDQALVFVQAQNKNGREPLGKRRTIKLGMVSSDILVGECSAAYLTSRSYQYSMELLHNYYTIVITSFFKRQLSENCNLSASLSCWTCGYETILSIERLVRVPAGTLFPKTEKLRLNFKILQIK